MGIRKIGTEETNYELPLPDVSEIEFDSNETNGIIVMRVPDYLRLRAQADKSTRRRRALKAHMKAYDTLRADNASLRLRLERAHAAMDVLRSQ